MINLLRFSAARGVQCVAMALLALVACAADVAPGAPLDDGVATFPPPPAVVVVATCATMPDGAACALDDGGVGACAHVDEPESPDFGKRFCAPAGPPCGALPPPGGCFCALDCPTPPPGFSAVCVDGACHVE